MLMELLVNMAFFIADFQNNRKPGVNISTCSFIRDAGQVHPFLTKLTENKYTSIQISTQL